MTTYLYEHLDEFCHFPLPPPPPSPTPHTHTEEKDNFLLLWQLAKDPKDRMSIQVFSSSLLHSTHPPLPFDHVHTTLALTSFSLAILEIHTRTSGHL